MRHLGENDELVRSLLTNTEDWVWEHTYDGLEGGDGSELFVKSKDKTLPSMHLLYQIIKRDVSPMEARPRERGRGRGYRGLRGRRRWGTVDGVQRR